MKNKFLRWLAPALSVLLLAGCTPDDPEPQMQNDTNDVAVNEPAKSQTTLKSQVLGEWVVVGDTAGQGHTGNLILNADGTFSGDYQGSGSSDTFEGTYEIVEEDVMGTPAEIVELTMTQYNGSPAPATPPIRLTFDPDQDMLTDFMTVTYLRASTETTEQD